MYQDKFKDAEWKPDSDDWLQFVSLNEAIDAAIPPTVAVMEVDALNAASQAIKYPNLENHFLFFKGIMYAALAQVGAKEVFYICTDDIPLDLGDPNVYPEGSYGWKMADIYWDSAQHDSWYMISHEEKEGDLPCGYDYGVSFFRNVFVTADCHWVHLVWIQMMADGGPPGDWFFVKGDKLKVESV